MGGVRTLPDALAVLTRATAHRREVGGPKSSKLWYPQSPPPLVLEVSVSVNRGYASTAATAVAQSNSPNWLVTRNTRISAGYTTEASSPSPI